MKTLLLLSAVLNLFYSFAQGQPNTKSEQLFNQRSPYQELSAQLIFKDVIPFDSLVYFARRIDVYTPLYTKTVFVVVTATDDIHHYIYLRDEKNPKNFNRLNLPINSLAFDVSRFELFAESPDDERYYIECNISTAYFHYDYDLVKKVLSVDSTFGEGK